MILRVALVLLVVLLAFPVRSEDTSSPSPFRIRPYLQNPTPDAMTIRWFSDSPDPGTLTLGPASSVPTKPSQQYVSAPILCRTLDYQLAEPREERHESLPFLHSLRLEGLAPATSYPYQVEQNGVTIKAILTTAPLPGKVGRGGGVRLFFYADSETQPESRGSRVQWPASPSQPSGPRPRWVADTYLADETTGYRMNLSLIATRAAESLRAGNPVLASVVGDLVESGGEQRDWDEFWRHNAGVFGTLASRVPIVAALGNHEMFGGPASDDPGKHLGGYSGSASLASSQKFLLYFQHPANGATDPRHDNRYHRINFGPVTLLTLDSTNGGSEDGADDTNHSLDNADTPHIPDYCPGSQQHAWLEKELAAAQKRGAITFVQFHHAPFSSGPHGLPAGTEKNRDGQSGQPLRMLAKLFSTHGVRAVFSGHDEMYEHSIVNGVHYYDVGIGGDGLRGPHDGVINDKQIFIAHDHAPEYWNGDVLEKGGKHYGHVEVDVTDVANSNEWLLSLTPVYVFPILDPDNPGEILRWERREYDDRVIVTVQKESP